MNNEINESQPGDSQCCVDHCQTTFQGAEQEVVNNYKCNQKRFSISNMWRIQKNKREFVRRSGL